MFQPMICVIELGPDRYAVECSGRYGGGYSCPAVSRAQALVMLARDARRYDCGEQPILVIAPEDLRREACL